MVKKELKKICIHINMIKITVFTDGASKGNGKKSAIGGIGVYFPTYNTLNYSEKIVFETFQKPVTNNLVELLAIKKAIEITKSQFASFELTIYTDSQYCFNIFTSWAKKWKTKNWTKADKKPILNLSLIKVIYDYCENYKIKFIHCNSHLAPPSDINSKEYFIWYGNDQADKLANKNIVFI